ncbi:MAG: hypothetical protein ABIX01_18680 [Chitinophagaceae bacterium]
MKRHVLTVTALLLLSIGIVAFRIRQTELVSPVQALKDLELKRSTAIGCGAILDLEQIDTLDMPLLTGWGHFSFPVTTLSDSAQIFFNQGISMYYAFHIIEALGSFKKAAAFDPECAMAWWGQAMAYGPNINDFGYSASPEALLANKNALEFAAGCTPREKALIQSTQVRYSADTTQSREVLNQRYADTLLALTKQFAADADIWTLYADALMVQHPWDLYEQNGTPKPWTPLIEKVLEKAISLAPMHPGANHYYIHTVEGSLNPSKGLAAAKKLTGLMPSVSHIVHMPSHIYIRTGMYADGETVNEEALTGYDIYRKAYSPTINAAFLYEMHNRHMQANCAQMEGRFAYATKASNDCRNSIDTSYMDAPGYFGTASQYVWMTPVFTMIRFGQWDAVLKEPEVPASRPYAAMIRHFGRGLAFARKHMTSEARQELKALRFCMKDSVLQIGASTFNPPIAPARVAENLLEGVIAEEMNEKDHAIMSLTNAVAMEDKLMYNEPRDWPLPARHYLGSALLRFGRPAGALEVLNKDLSISPNNGWALYGISQAAEKLKNTGAAKHSKSLLDKAFARYDLINKAVVF